MGPCDADALPKTQCHKSYAVGKVDDIHNSTSPPPPASRVKEPQDNRLPCTLDPHGTGCFFGAPTPSWPPTSTARPAERMSTRSDTLAALPAALVCGSHDSATAPEHAATRFAAYQHRKRAVACHMTVLTSGTPKRVCRFGSFGGPGHSSDCDRTRRCPLRTRNPGYMSLATESQMMR
jgi:hypothetical protein